MIVSFDLVPISCLIRHIMVNSNFHGHFIKAHCFKIPEILLTAGSVSI
jgi:hypothetical protein